MNKGVWMGKYSFSILFGVLTLCLMLVFQTNTARALDTAIDNQENIVNNATKERTEEIVSVDVKNEPTEMKEDFNDDTKIQQQAIQTPIEVKKTQEIAQKSPSIKAQPTPQPKTIQKTQVVPTKIYKKPTTTVTKTTTKPKSVSKPVNKAKSTITKTTPKKVAPTIKKKVVTKTTKKKQIKSNYYNQAPKRWPSKIPGSQHVRDFGQTTKASGINDALKIMKASGNKGVTIGHTKPRLANIATIFNWNSKARALTYGTGTAIGRYTILTANHVINNPQSKKPMTPAKIENLRINLLHQGKKIVRSLKVTGVKMLQHGDAALLYTNEDISKYMKIRKIAPEKSITKIKANTPIQLYHYGLPTGKYKKDPMGTMYHSKGKYSMMARNVNPIGYYQMKAEPGSSGGAILNSKNEVLGVHSFRINSGEYKKYNLNTMSELRGKLRKEILKNIKW